MCVFGLHWMELTFLTFAIVFPVPKRLCRAQPARPAMIRFLRVDRDSFGATFDDYIIFFLLSPFNI